MDANLQLLAALALIYFALWASPYSSFQVRYLVPIVPVLSVLAAAVIRTLRPLLRMTAGARAPRLLAAGVTAILLLNLPPFFPLADARSWTPSIMRTVGPRSWATVLGAYGTDRYLAGKVRPYEAVRYMNEVLPDDARVVSFAVAAHFYAKPELLHDYSRCVGASIWNMGPGQEENTLAVLQNVGVSRILWDKTRTDGNDSDLVIRSTAFLERHGRLLYEDEWVELIELLPPWARIDE